MSRYKTGDEHTPLRCEDCSSTEDVMSVTVFRPHLLCRRCVATLPDEVRNLAEIKDATAEKEGE